MKLVFRAMVLPLVIEAFLLVRISPALPDTVIYSTGFQPGEGFDPSFTLIGQGGWIGSGSGGNGLVTNFFEGFGQQAYIGFTPPEGTNNFLNVWHPLDIGPVSPMQPVIKFSVVMQIVDSTSTN